jgi:prepilin signal peptidase PulO-like enzyme (type II secretory pathway)
MLPLSGIALAEALVSIITADKPFTALLSTVTAVIVGGGIFYILYQVSEGKWIGGGDVKLGWLLGLVVGTPAKSLLVIFIAAFLGSFVSLPLLASKRLSRTSTIPFGPFLIIGAIIVQLFGHAIILWYQRTFLSMTL